MKIHPVTFVWREVETINPDGIATRCRAMVPLPRFDNVCDRQFEVGAEYPLVVVEERSQASHNAYFAAIKTAFDNLPEKIAARWETPEHLRKWVLIETGWYDEFEFPCPNDTFAKRLATFIRKESEYSRGFRRESLMIIRTPKSQSLPAMKRQAFEDSKKAVLDYLEHLTGIPVSTLKKEAGRHE